MKNVRKIIEIDEEKCDGCGNCVISCAEGAIRIIDGKAKLVRDSYCDGLGACLGECPQGALRLVEREAEEFDPEAVEEYLRDLEHRKTVEVHPLPCGCPSSHVRTFQNNGGEIRRESPTERCDSALSHWPVQLNLIPASAPFLKGADLLVAADCTVLACPNFHRDFLKGKVVVMGCPKLDKAEEYLKKFTEIFKLSGIRSLMVLEMEVPCCAAMASIVKRSLEAAGKEIPLEEVVIGVRGEILKREKMAA
ncbi:MAG: 4Fe-4S binding protein [Deltaproteobacteria bacterium]|nr:4Fe-4S binding protein [Deltaproteobacteria bacterium]